jgi:release factor glutamine methyltransferase
MKFSTLCESLRASGIEDAVYEAFVMADELCGISEARLMAFPETELCGVEEALARRLDGEPLQYIIGKWEFYGLPFSVREGCLIPRADTETLVELAVKRIPENIAFADLCSGSGCIGIAVLANRRDLTCLSVDLFDVPLELTRENSERNYVSDRLHAVKADVLSDYVLPDDIGFILSNPPYIRSDVVPTLDGTVLREPHTALDGGNDGLVFYRRILDICKEKRIPALLEIGFDQGEALCVLSMERGLSCEIHKDLSGNDRVAEIKIGETKK